MNNLVQIKKPGSQLGINLSFTIECMDSPEAKIHAQIVMEQFHDAVQNLRKEQYPQLVATVTSRQEYMP